uniref:Uncharacterized protein n=1 Tax=viral metagenome TaxID=1070528 RepID=A0A6C0JI02_9ZZZZ
MINDINYAFNKKDYFYYFFIGLIIFIFISKTSLFNFDNIIPFIITLGILYFLVKKKIIKDFSDMDLQNNKLKKINVDRYKYLRTDVYIIDAIIKLNNLSLINRTKFNQFLKYTDKFFMYYAMSKAKNLKPVNVYENAYDNSVRALNTLLSFQIELKNYGYLINDREISTEKNITINNNFDSSIEDIRKRFSLFLTEIEKKINKDWFKGEINIYSKPIYPDDVKNVSSSDILYSDKFNLL